MNYETAHRRVKTARGKASNYQCVHCRRHSAKHWAYDHADPVEVVDSRGRRYGTIEHYMPLCYFCHTNFDRPHSSHRRPIDRTDEGDQGDRSSRSTP